MWFESCYTDRQIRYNILWKNVLDCWNVFSSSIRILNFYEIMKYCNTYLSTTSVTQSVTIFVLQIHPVFSLQVDRISPIHFIQTDTVHSLGSVIDHSYILWTPHYYFFRHVAIILLASLEKGPLWTYNCCA